MDQGKLGGGNSGTDGTYPQVPIRKTGERFVRPQVAPKEGPSLLAANRHFVEVLRRKNYPVTYEEFGGTHEPVHWRDTLPDGLMLLAK